MLAGTPPALGSWWGLVAVAALGAVVVARLRYRLIPGVW
jgi:hypothetical protein